METQAEDEDVVPERKPDNHMPRLLAEELDCVRCAIKKTSLPSWVNQLPLKLGSASAGSLKAAEWGILYFVFYPLVLIPLWDLSDLNENRKVLSDNLVKLVCIMHMLSHRMITTATLWAAPEAIRQY